MKALDLIVPKRGFVIFFMFETSFLALVLHVDASDKNCRGTGTGSAHESLPIL